MIQSASTVLMISPDYFGYNAETAVSNTFQKSDLSADKIEISEKALREFRDFTDALKNAGIEVLIEKDLAEPLTPDAVFPNNWVMFHHSGDISLFPMAAPSRRNEKRADIIENLSKTYRVKTIYDYSPHESREQFLEATGSMVFDHIHKIAYACLSPRTDLNLFREFCRDHHYEPLYFTALDQNKREIYHTNVMMCIGKNNVLICLESLQNDQERKRILSSFRSTGHEIVEISPEQMNCFAGNMLQLTNTRGDELMVMSSQARNSLEKEQIETIERHCRIIHSPLNTIEYYGGGSARCMIAEVFLPRI